jgi:phosphohistidine swiveling domain-containing protein
MPTWKRCGNWTMSLLSWTAFGKLYREGKDCNPMFLEFKDGLSVYYQTEEEMLRVKENIRKQIDEDPSFLKNKIENIKRLLENDKHLLEKLNENLQDNQPNLPKLFNDYWRLYEDTIFGMAIDIYFDDILCGKLTKFLKEKLQELGMQEAFNDYFASLTAPLKFTTTQEEEISLLRIMLQAKEQQEDLLKEHLASYAHIPMWFDNDPWNLDDLKDRTQPFKNREEIESRLDTLTKELDSRKEKSSKILSQLKPPQDMLELIKIIQEFAFLRQEGEVQISYHNFHGTRLKEKICDKLGITRADLKFLTDDEIIANLRNKDPKLLGNIKERQKYCFMIMQDGNYTIYTGDQAIIEAQKIKDKLEQPIASMELKGVVGSTGNAKGKVCILNGLSDIPKIEEGDIMVVSGTSVEYIAAMEKAAGIIAEIGGITSHAAIVARELKKPCLTRVENATRLLKDGELVELDTQQGVLRRVS